MVSPVSGNLGLGASIDYAKITATPGVSFQFISLLLFCSNFFGQASIDFLAYPLIEQGCLGICAIGRDSDPNVWTFTEYRVIF